MATEAEQKAKEKAMYPVDAEHGQLRLVVAGVFIGVAIISFFVLLAVIPANTLNLLAVLGALVIAAVFTSVVERQLKARWPSGREIGLRDDKLVLAKRGNTIDTIAIDGEAQLLQWCFEINKRARVPRGWWMVAAAVRNMATDHIIAVYTLMPPEDYRELNDNQRYIPLKKPSDTDDGNMRLAGQQRRLHAAEQVRWNDGAEMKPEDFRALMGSLEARFNA